MMHPHNLYHLTLRICISRGVRHTSQRSATSPSPFIIIFLEFFFLKSNPPSILPFPPPPKKKKKFPTLRTHCDFSSQAQPFALIYALPFRFSSMFDGYAVFYLVMFILSLSPRVGTGDDQRGDEIMKKKRKERGKKKTRVQRFDGNGIEWSGITEIAMIVSFVDSFIIDWLLLLLQIILLRVPHLNDEQSYYDYRIIFFSFPPSPLIFLLFSFLGACRTMYSRCQR